MGSEGYLINEFIAQRYARWKDVNAVLMCVDLCVCVCVCCVSTNKRTDEWGGSYQNRIKFPIEIVRSIRERVSGRASVLHSYMLNKGMRD